MDINEFKKFQIKSLEVVLKEDVGYPPTSKDYFKEVYFIPNNLTQVKLEDVDLTTTFMGHKFQFPICVGSLLGGSKKLIAINQRVGEFCQKYQLAQGLGDQIHGLQSDASEDVLKSYKVARAANPNGFLMGNLSAKYIASSSKYLNEVEDAINMIDADALEIYIDPLVDVLWGERKPGSIGFLDRLSKLTKAISTPIIVKTMCTGFTHEDVRSLWDCGVSGISAQGVGGTSFPRIETLKKLSLSQKQQEPAIKHPYDYFGTPTVWSLLDIVLRKENRDIPLIIGGGIRDGRQAVKALALGADMVSIAYPVLIEIMEDFGYPAEQNLEYWFQQFIDEMRMTMMLLGARNIQELRQIIRSRVVIMGKTKEWVEGRRLIFPPEYLRENLS